MKAFTLESVPKIDKHVDFVNVMSYDLMTTRDKKSKPSVSAQGTLDAIDRYLRRGFPAHKLAWGVPFHAKWFMVKPGWRCHGIKGCLLEKLENDDGSPTDNSGAVTFQKESYEQAPKDLNVTTDGTCGRKRGLKCGGKHDCCSGQGFW
jgi:chitinase